MADLPNERIDERTLKTRRSLFLCLTARAVHIEVAQLLDTESCLAAVKRFIARRGYPSNIISDNETNLVGEDREMKAFTDGTKLRLGVT